MLKRCELVLRAKCQGVKHHAESFCVCTMESVYYFPANQRSSKYVVAQMDCWVLTFVCLASSFHLAASASNPPPYEISLSSLSKTTTINVEIYAVIEIVAYLRSIDLRTNS